MTTYIWKVSDWKPAHDQLNHNGGQYNITLKHRKLSFNHTGNKKNEFKKLSKGDKNHDKIAAECSSIDSFDHICNVIDTPCGY